MEWIFSKAVKIIKSQRHLIKRGESCVQIHPYPWDLYKNLYEVYLKLINILKFIILIRPPFPGLLQNHQFFYHVQDPFHNLPDNVSNRKFVS